jgi:hypothetical protein
MYVCIYRHTYKHTHTLYIYTHTHTHTHIKTNTCIHTPAQATAPSHIYTHTDTHKHKHLHTHTCSSDSSKSHPGTRSSRPSLYIRIKSLHFSCAVSITSFFAVKIAGVGITSSRPNVKPRSAIQRAHSLATRVMRSAAVSASQSLRICVCV